MAYLGVTAARDGTLAAGPSRRPLHAALAAALAGLAPQAPVAILVHGYKFDPAGARTDPRATLFADAAARPGGAPSWPAGLGFLGGAPEAGLCIGFGWPAREPHLQSLAATGRTGFARVYDRAGEAGRWLAALVSRVQALAPGRPVDLLAHSLGARVALSALPHLPRGPGRVILLGAAEFEGRAMACLAAPAAAATEVYNVTARANDVYDLMFELFAPRASWSDRALGLGGGPRPGRWVDLQLDRPETAGWAARQGFPLGPAHARFCHWGFYTRPGALAIYGAILRRRPGLEAARLRAEPCLVEQEPRWSRVLPRPATRRRTAALAPAEA